jgi:ABC-2 type transport system ATP-binding protein
MMIVMRTMPTQEAPRLAPLPAAQATDVTYSYAGRRALDRLSLEVPRGTVFGLLGPNGSGKSTLLSILAGLRSPESGSVRVLGVSPSPALRQRIGYLFQATSLDPLMSAWETLWLHGRLYGMGGASLRSRVRAALQVVKLAERAQDQIALLSGGMKRRLELARALLTSPELLLLDEPTTGLDPDSEQAFWSHLHDLRGAGTTVLMATNKVGEADRYCDRVAFMHRGTVVAEGPPSELKAGLKHDGVWLEGSFGPELVQSVSAWPEVGRLTWAPPVLHVTVDSASAFVPRFFQTAGETIISVRIREATLEDAYFDIVGTYLSAEGAS